MTIGGLSSQEAVKRRAKYGWNEVADLKPSLIFLFLRKFWGSSAWMIEIIAILSLILHKSADFGIALALLFFNAALSFFEERRADSTVDQLRKRLQIQARVLRDGAWRKVPARELVPGDKVHIRLGDIVPADLKIEFGSAEIDQSVLTGESAEVQKSSGDSVYSGSLVRRGEATCEVSAIGAQTYFGRTIELVQTARPRLHIEEIVSKLVRYMLLILSLLIVVTLGLSIFRGEALSEILPLSLILLMSAVPVALPVMYTVSTAMAARKLGAKGVLVTRLSAAEDAATMDLLFVDKTGTITENRISVVSLTASPEVDTKELLLWASLASDESSKDPIDDAILSYSWGKIEASKFQDRKRFNPFSPETRRTEGVVHGTNSDLIATKGAITEILSWSGADSDLERTVRASVDQAASRGHRSIAVARSLPDGKRKFLGLIFLQDPPRVDSAELVRELRRLGVQVKMLTGDARPVAQEIAAQVGLGAIEPWSEAHQEIDWGKIDGLAQVFPQTKFQVIDAAQAHGHIVGMTGDGVNDAPALKKAEVGIAVSAATDSAKSAASVVLTSEGLSGILDLVENGRAVYQRILTWIINKISRTVLKSGFVVAAYFLFGKFVISAFAMILLVFMTDFAKISLSTDNVRISSYPDSWRIRPLLFLGVFLGGIMVAESIFLLWVAIHVAGISIHSSRIHTSSFLILLFLAVFSVFSIRERHSFWSSRPSWPLIFALAADAGVGIAIGLRGTGSLPAIGLPSTMLLLFLSGMFSLGVNDFAKGLFLRRAL